VKIDLSEEDIEEGAQRLQRVQERILDDLDEVKTLLEGLQERLQEMEAGDGV